MSDTLQLVVEVREIRLLSVKNGDSRKKLNLWRLNDKLKRIGHLLDAFLSGLETSQRVVSRAGLEPATHWLKAEPRTIAEKRRRMRFGRSSMNNQRRPSVYYRFTDTHEDTPTRKRIVYAFEHVL
jgi:hypothetical protein